MRRHRLALAIALGCVAATLVPAAATTAAGPAHESAHPLRFDHVEVWRLHPSKAAARQPKFRLTVAYDGSGDRGALLVVEDRHIPESYLDHGPVGFGYAELGNDRFFPQVYDNPAGVSATDCSVPVIAECSTIGSGDIAETLSWDFSKIISNGRPAPYDFHDVYVGAVNARITGLRLSGPVWTISRATNATMVLIQNQDTNNGIGARVANYTVEKFAGADLHIAKNQWAAVHTQLPCPNSLAIVPTPQDDARLTGYTLPDDGQPYLPLSCQGMDSADVFATGATTVRLAMDPAQAPMGADQITAAQNLNRLVALIVTPVARKQKGTR